MRCIRGAIAIAAAVVLTAEATVSQGGGANARAKRHRGGSDATANHEMGQTGEANHSLIAATQRRVRERSKPRKRKSGGRFYEQGIGARSAAGGMTALSLRRSVRGHRFQMHHYRGCAGGPLKN